MHYHMEIIMPPMEADQIEKSVADLMAPFDENNEEIANRHFWDWYQIGGRFSTFPSAIRTIEDLKEDLTASAVMIARINPVTKTLEPGYLIHREYWNGVCFIETAWDGKVSQALEMAKDFLSNSQDNLGISFDWLTVCVDYHS